MIVGGHRTTFTTVAPPYGIEFVVFGEKRGKISKMEKLDNLLAGKVKALRFTLSKTDDIVKKGNKIALNSTSSRCVELDVRCYSKVKTRY